MSGNGKVSVDAASDRVVVDGLLRLVTRWYLDEVQIFVAGEIHPDNARTLSGELNDAVEGSAGSVLVDIGAVELWSDTVDRVLVQSRLLATMRPTNAGH